VQINSTRTPQVKLCQHVPKCWQMGSYVQENQNKRSYVRQKFRTNPKVDDCDIKHVIVQAVDTLISKVYTIVTVSEYKLQRLQTKT